MNLSRVFHYQFCLQTKIRRSESRTLVPPNQTIVPVPDHRSGHPLVRVRFRMPSSESLRSWGLLRSERDGLLAFPWGVFGRQPAAVGGCRLVAECGLVYVWGICGSGPYDVAFGVAKICCGCLPSGDCDFSCARSGGDSSCLDARSLALPRYCLGVGLSVRMEITSRTSGIEFLGICVYARRFLYLTCCSVYIFISGAEIGSNHITFIFHSAVSI